MLIDFHTHVFPKEISKRALDKLSYVSGGLAPVGKATDRDFGYIERG